MPTPATAAPTPSPPTASAYDTARTAGMVLAPLAARGLILRRPRPVAAVGALDLDRRAVDLLWELHGRYGRGPLRLAIPGRSVAMVLDPADVRRVLDGSPEPFALATREKRAALSHFQPHGLLASHGAERQVRRRLNEQVLDSDLAIHHLAGRFTAVVVDEVAAMLRAAPDGLVDLDALAAAWWRVARRITFGDAAREDDRLTDGLHALRRNANWAWLRPVDTDLRDRWLGRLRAHLDRAEDASLAGVLAESATDDRAAPLEQIPQWLFAFDAAGIALMRTLAVLAHDDERVDELAAEAATAVGEEGTPLLPLLRGCVLESLRLWPTTPGILRDTTEETTWSTGTLPAGTSLVLHAPFLHRNPEADSPHRFNPHLWTDQGAADRWPLVPFSDGPGRCPGQNLVLLTTSTFLAALLGSVRPRLAQGPALDPDRLPAALDPFDLVLDLSTDRSPRVAHPG